MLLILLALAACTREADLTGAGRPGADALISLSIPLPRSTQAPYSDNNISTLRVIIFKSTELGHELGSVVVNELITPLPGAESVDLKIVVPVGYLNIYLVGNETEAMRLGDITGQNELTSRRANYSPSSAVKSPFLMYGEFRAVKVYDDGRMTLKGADFPGTGKNVEILRCVSKVELDLRSTLAEVVIRRIEVINLPKYPWLTPSVPYGVAEGFYTWESDDSPPCDLTNSGSVRVPDIAIYLPEHIVVDAAHKTVLRIWGSLKGVDLSEPWEIILGDAIGKLEYANTKLPDNLLAEEYRITRNTRFEIAATIRKPPGGVDIDIVTSVANWLLISIDHEL